MDTLRVFTLNVTTSSLGGELVSTTRTTTRTTRSVEARHWIERQLRWERTLGTLRDRRAGHRPAKAA